MCLRGNRTGQEYLSDDARVLCWVPRWRAPAVSVNIQRYMDLFIHRRDVFSEQQKSGAYFPVREPITEDDVLEHLAGHASYGTYVIRPEDQTVKYVVFDLDTHDETAQAYLRSGVEQLVSSVSSWGVLDSLLQESSGSKGVHVWLFLSEPLPARQVRAWVESFFLPYWRAVQPATPIEVFPKQDAVELGGYGNLVKLPLGVHAVSGKKSAWDHVQGWASGIADVQPLDSSLVPVYLQPPVRPESGKAGEGEGNSRPAHGAGGAPASPFPCIDKILREGVGEGYRDRAMFHLALYFYGHGLDPDLAEEACMRANAEFDPPLTEKEVNDKVASAYRGRFASAKCGSDWLAEICPGPCREGWSVRKAAAGTLKRVQPGDTIDVEVVRVVSADKTRVTVSHPDADNQPTLVVR